MIYKTLHRKLKFEQQEPRNKTLHRKLKSEQQEPRNKTIHRKLKSEQQEPRKKIVSQTRRSAKVSSPYSTIGIGRVTFVKHPVAYINSGSGVIVTTIKGTYPWSLMRYSVFYK